jgi:hypothetical protein
MKASLVRILFVASITAVAACGGADEPGATRLSTLKEGMTLTQALDAMGKGPLTATYSDTMRLLNGYRRMRYMMNGADFNVVYSRDLPGDVKEPVLQAKETPVVFRNDTLLGWGWRYFVDEGMAKYQLPTPLRAIDTMTTPLLPDTTKKIELAPAPTVPAAPANPDSNKKS